MFFSKIPPWKQGPFLGIITAAILTPLAIFYISREVAKEQKEFLPRPNLTNQFPKTNLNLLFEKPDLFFKNNFPTLNYFNPPKGLFFPSFSKFPKINSGLRFPRISIKI